MKRMMLALAVLMLMLAGCRATKAVKQSDAVPVPQDRMMGYQSPQGADGAITFIRDRGYLGKGCMIEVRIDDKPVADLKTGEKVTANVTTGRHTIYGKPAGGGLCQIGQNGNRSVRAEQVEVQKGDDLAYRVATDTDDIITLSIDVN